MALIELVDFNDIYSNGKAVKVEKAKTTRRGKTTKKDVAPKAEGTTEETAPEA